MDHFGAHRGARRRRTAAAVAAAAVAAGVLALAGPVSSASAAGSCRGNGCTGHDPKAAGCDADARTLKTVYGVDPAVKGDLRYSPSCDAAWVQTYSWRVDSPVAGTVYGQLLSNGQYVSFRAESTPGRLAGGTRWSPMIGGRPHYDISVNG